MKVRKHSFQLVFLWYVPMSTEMRKWNNLRMCSSNYIWKSSIQSVDLIIFVLVSSFFQSPISYSRLQYLHCSVDYYN